MELLTPDLRIVPPQSNLVTEPGKVLIYEDFSQNGSPLPETTV